MACALSLFACKSAIEVTTFFLSPVDFGGVLRNCLVLFGFCNPLTSAKCAAGAGILLRCAATLLVEASGGDDTGGGGDVATAGRMVLLRAIWLPS